MVTSAYNKTTSNSEEHGTKTITSEKYRGFAQSITMEESWGSSLHAKYRPGRWYALYPLPYQPNDM
jgi:hypothetical protein